jgi:hypothetical protein
MDRDVFVLAVINEASPAEAMRHALEITGINAARVDDAVFGYDGSLPPLNTEQITHEAGLTCQSVNVSSSLRAIFFAAQSILSGDLELVIVIGVGEGTSTTLLLASPDSVGRYNLLPRARLAARSLSGTDAALRAAGLAIDEVSITKSGDQGALLVKELLEELEQQQKQWGLVSTGRSALLMERI